MKNKAEIKYTVGEGEEAVEKVVIVRKPNAKQRRDASIVYSKAFSQALKDGALLEARLNSYVREQGLWNDEKEERLRKLVTEMGETQKKLAAGGIKKSEGRELAIRMRVLRIEWTNLVSETSSLKDHTAEGQADNARFHYFASVCLVDETGTPIFKDVDDYLENGNEPHIYEAVTELATLESDLDPEWENNLPENKFLVKYGFVNEDLSLVDKEGRLVNVEGKLINEEGELINEEGELVDWDGKVIEKDVEEPVFFDDDE